MITIDEFKKMDIRIGTIVEAEKIEGTDKLMRLTVDIGLEKRQLVAGTALSYIAEELEGKQVCVLANLEPRTLRGVESCGMILAASDEDGNPILILPEKNVPDGARVK